MDDEAELDELSPILRRRRICPSEIVAIQHINEPPNVIIRLNNGNSLVCTRASFEAAGLNSYDFARE